MTARNNPSNLTTVDRISRLVQGGTDGVINRRNHFLEKDPEINGVYICQNSVVYGNSVIVPRAYASGPIEASMTHCWCNGKCFLVDRPIVNLMIPF